MPNLTAGIAFYKKKLWIDKLGAHHFGECMEYTCVCDLTYSHHTKSILYHQAVCL